MQSKKELRKLLLQKRLSMSDEEVRLKSEVITNQVVAILEKNVFHCLHYFEPITSLHEVDIQILIEIIRRRWPSATLHTSRKLNNYWQIVDNVGGKPIRHLPEYDIILLPMLGFDIYRHRLGYGGGFYDRLLLSQHSAKTIGVSFEFGKIPNIPNEEHDMVLGTIVTEECIY